MTRPTSALLLGCFALVSATAAAVAAVPGEQSLSAGHGRCMKQSGGVTAKMLECIGNETRLQDARLNAEYRRTLAAVPAKRQAGLRATQRLWVQYRDANCRWHADPDGGTAAALAAADCVLTMTAARADELVRLRPEF
ncbi:MAG: lysozyme inhibitor LprI family protein [Luteimonas sp.]